MALAGGGDWILARPDGASEINVRVTLRTDDEQLIGAPDDRMVQNNRAKGVGLVDQTCASWNQTVVWLGQLEGLRAGELGKSGQQATH